jgi:arylsulfatase A-like enzyme
MLRSRLWLPLAAVLMACFGGARGHAADARPNVLFIAIDDLRDWVHYLGYEQVKTPNLDKLSARGLTFARGYCASPVCNPSRAALMSGMRSSTTGVYNNGIDWRPLITDKTPTLPQQLRANGYFACGSGKIYHDSFRRPTDWDDYLGSQRGAAAAEAGEAPAQKARGQGKGKNKANAEAAAAAGERDPNGVGGIKFKPLPDARDEDMVDYHSVTYALKQLNDKHDKPLFLACGLHKPHMPWDVPQKYYNMYPLDTIQLPKVLKDDLADIPPAGVKMAKPEGDHAAMLASGRWKEAVQGYLAAITFCDAMVGRLIDGFDQSPAKDNTIIILWSDHGWHLGEKEHWRKFALWEESTRAPFLMIVPGLTKPGSVCNRPVDYMNIYPTLCDLTGTPLPKHLEGGSMKPLLANPAAAWDRPAITTHGFQNHAVRTDKWRYIRYEDGGEELYDEVADPHEWKNLAGDSGYASIKQDLAKWLPKTNVPTPPGTEDSGGGKGKAAKAAAKLKAK